MKCIKCGNTRKVDLRYEICEECLRVDVWTALTEALKPGDVSEQIRRIL